MQKTTISRKKFTDLTWNGTLWSVSSDEILVSDLGDWLQNTTDNQFTIISSELVIDLIRMYSSSETANSALIPIKEILEIYRNSVQIQKNLGDLVLRIRDDQSSLVGKLSNSCD